MDNSLREFDIIIFGATGFTGQYVIEELVNTIAVSNSPNSLKWAVAGRNEQKLRKSLDEVQQYLKGINILDTPIVIADVSDETSISDMCKRTKLIFNCVGPYKLYGEIVVSSCVRHGTHHVDLSGEFKYLETMQAKYFHSAREKGVYIVEACGFDSIPADYGISMMKNKFPGDLNSVEYYVEVSSGPSGRTTNIGTFHSAIESVNDFLALKQYDRMLETTVFKKPTVQSKHQIPWRFPLFFSDVIKAWCLWFVGPDERVIQRSQRFRYEYLNERPVQFKGYLKMPSVFSALLAVFFVSLLGFISFFKWGRDLLLKHPSFFTMGQFSNTGPTRKQVEEGKSVFTLIGEGWTDKLAEPTDQHEHKPNKKMKLTIVGGEPAYAFTSVCMVQAGLTVLLEKEKLPLEGGVLTPGVAFASTSLHQRLEKRGVTLTFEEIL